MSNNLPIGALNELVETLTSELKKEGGLARFFAALDDDAYEAIGISDRSSVTRALWRMIEDREFRSAVLSRIVTEDRPLIDDFFDLLDLWRELNPDETNWLRARLSRESYAILRGPVPTTVNAFLDVNAVITVDSRSEEYSVKCGVTLGWASKGLGGDHVFVTSSPISPFLGSIRMMLEELRLNDDEIEVMKLPAERRVHAAIATELASIQEELDALKVQFEKLKR